VHRYGLSTPDLQHAGIGATIDKVRCDSTGHHHIRITKLVENGSIYRDGRLHVGDRITHINGKHVEEWQVDKILEEIIGPCGSLVELKMLRDTSSKGAPAVISLERGTPIYWHFVDKMSILERQIKEKDAELERIKEDYEAKLRERDIRHAAEMEQRTQEWQKQLAAELKDRDASFSAAVKDYREELKNASRAHAEALRSRDDAMSKAAKEFRDQLLQHSNNHAQERQAMSKEHAAALQGLVKEHDAAQRRLAAEYDARLRECHQQQEAALLEQQREMEKRRTEMEAHLLARMATTVEEMSNKHQEMLARAEADMKQQVAKIQQSCDLAVQQRTEERDAAQAQAMESQRGLSKALATIRDLEQASELLTAEHESLKGNVAKLTEQLSKLREQKSAIVAAYRETELSLQDQLFDAIDESNVYKAELDAFYALPNPTGVGLVIETTTGKDLHITEVVGVIPGMSAAASGVISLADRVMAVDGIAVKGRSNDEIKTMLSGRRGSRVAVSFSRPVGEDYTLVLKRGAWGEGKVKFAWHAREGVSVLQLTARFGQLCLCRPRARRCHAGAR